MANEFDALVNDLLGPNSIPVTPQPISSSPGMRGEFDTLVTDLEQPQSQPITSVQRNPVMDIPTAAVAGLTDLAELYARAYQGSDVPGSELMTVEGQVDPLNQFANWLIQNKDKFEKEHPYIYAPAEGEGTVRKWFREGARAVVPSLGASVPSAIAGSALGGPVGAVTGYVGGGATIFGLAEYDQFIQDVQKYNTEHPDKAVPAEIYQNNAIKSAIFEGGLEGLNDLIEAATFKVGGLLTKPMKSTIKDILGQGLKESTKAYVKGQAVLQPSEMLTEAGQEYYETALRNEIGIDDTDPKDAALAALGPTFFSTLIMGTGAHVLNVRQNSKIAKALENPETDFDARFNAMHVMYKELKKQDKVNGTNFAETWGKVAQYKLLNKEGVNIEETLSSIKPVETILKEKATTEQLNTDVTKFEERDKEKPVIEDIDTERPGTDKTITPTGHTLETRQIIYNNLIDKGFGEERANELATRIMGAKEVPVAPTTKVVNTEILDEFGKNIQKEVPLDSTNETIKLTPGESILSNIPEGLRNQFVYKQSGGLFSGPGNVKAILKKQGLNKEYGPLLIAPGEWIGAPLSLIQMIDTMKGVSSKTTPQIITPVTTISTRENIPEQEYNKVQPEDLSNKGVPFTNKISAQLAINRHQKQFNAPEDFYEIVNLGEKQFVARPKKLVQTPQKVETARDIINRRNQEYLDAIKLSDQNGISKLDEIIQNLKDEGHENTPAYKQTVQRRDIIARRIARDKIREAKEVKPTKKVKGFGNTITVFHGSGSLFNKFDDKKLIPEDIYTEDPDRFVHWFTTDKNTASPYLERHMMEFYRQVRDTDEFEKWYASKDKTIDPQDVEAEFYGDVADFITEIFLQENPNFLIDKQFDNNFVVYTAKVNNNNILTINSPTELDKGSVTDQISIILKQAKKDGYKGVFIKNLPDVKYDNKTTDALAMFYGEDINIIDNTHYKRSAQLLENKRDELPKFLQSKKYDKIFNIATQQLPFKESQAEGAEVQGPSKAKQAVENLKAKVKEKEEQVQEKSIKDRLTARLITARLKLGENVSDETVAKFKTVAIRWSRNPETGKWEEHEPNYKRKMTEEEREKKEDIRNVLKAEANDRRKETEAQTKATKEKVANITKSKLFTPIAETRTLLDNYTVLEPSMDRRMLRKMEPINFPNAFRAMINHAIQVNDGTIDFAMIDNFISQLEQASKSGRLNSNFDTNVDKQLFDKRLGLVKTHLEQARDYISKHQKEMAKKREQAIIDQREAKLAELDEGAKPFEEEDNGPLGKKENVIAFPNTRSIKLNVIDTARLHTLDVAQIDFAQDRAGIAATVIFNDGSMQLFQHDINGSWKPNFKWETAKHDDVRNKLYKDLSDYLSDDTIHKVFTLLDTNAKLGKEVKGLSGWFHLNTERGSIERAINGGFSEPLGRIDNPNATQTLSIPQVQVIINGFKNVWVNQPNTIIVKDRAELLTIADETLTDYIKKTPDRVRMGGVLHHDTIFLIADELIGRDDVIKTMIHEMVGHYGVAKTLGPEFNEVCVNVFNNFKDTTLMKKLIKDYDHYNPSERQGQQGLGAEFIAKMSEDKAYNPTFWEYLIQEVKRILNKMFGTEFQLPDNQIRALIMESNKFIEGKKDYGKVEDYFETPVRGNQESPVPWAYSALLKGVQDNLKSMPAKVQSLRKWLEKFAKPEEIKWMGVEQFFGNKVIINKDEFLDFLKSNQIELKEITRGEPIEKALDRLDLTHTIDWDQELLDSGADEPYYAIVRAGDRIIGRENFGSEQEAEEWAQQTEDNYASDHANTPLQLHNTTPLTNEQLTEPLNEFPVKWASLQVPGGENYREMQLIYNPGKKLPLKDVIKEGGRPSDVHETAYQSSHWNEPNVLAHIRWNERTDDKGNKILFIEEIQSDWLQAAKHEGFIQTQGDLTAKAIPNENKPGTFWGAVIDQNGNYVTKMGEEHGDDPVSRDEALSWANYQIDNLAEMGDVTAKGKDISKAPFLENWDQLCMKRMIRYAAENGFDGIAWTTGEQHIQRYESALRKHVKEIKWHTIPLTAEEKAQGKLKDKFIDVIEHSGIINSLQVDSNGIVTSGFRGTKGHSIAEVVGKELAIKIMSKGSGSISDLDIKIGGKGMKVAYDERLPNFIKKYVKQWGAKLETINLGEQPKLNQPGFYLTPEMKHDVIYKGQPLWNKQGIDQTKLLQDIEQKFDTTSGFVYGAGILLPSGNSLSSTKMHEDLIYDIQQQIPELKSKDMGTILKLLKGIRTRAFGKDDLYAEIPLGIKPTEAQYSTIERALNKETGSLTYDIVNESNQTIMSSGVVNTINEFKRIFTGQGMSDVARWHKMGDVYGRRIVDFQDATPETSRQELKDLFSDQAYALLKTMSMQLPKNLPSLTWTERYLLSPEFYSHPTLEKIVKAAIERHDRYYEIFNELNNIDHQFNGEDNIIDLNIKLKYKGINFTGKNITDKVSSEWQQFEKMQDEIDTGEWRQNYGENDQTTWEQHYRIQGVPDEVIELYKLHRTAYDNALNLLITPMQTLVTEIERVAQRDNTKPKYPMFTTLDEQGQPIKISLKEVINRMGQLRGTYAPRIREIGNYVIKGKRFEKVVRYHKSNRVEAEVLKRELERKGYKVENIHERERLPEDVYASLRIINTQKAIETAMKGMQEKELDTELLAKFNEELIRNVADLVRMRGFRSSMIARGKGEVVRGYITDPNERFVRYINNIAAGVAKGEAAKKMFGLIAGEYQGEGKDRKKVGGIDPSIDHRAYDTATKYIEEQLRNTDTGDRIIGLVKSIATFKYLGLNPRSPVVNVLSLVTTVPMAMHTHALEGKGSMIIIGKELAKAANDYVNIMRGKKLTNKDEQAYMDEIKRKGYDTPQYTRDALGTIQRAHGKAWAKTMYWSMYIFGKSEQWIRGTTMLASYRLLKSKNKGMSEVDLRDKAHFISNRAHGVYGKSTQLAVGQGTGPEARLAQLLYTYQKFGHTYLQALYEAGVRKGNIKGFLYGLMSPIILSGLAVVPFKDFWWKLIGIVLSILGIKDDPEKGFWDWIRKKFGNTTERVGRHGLLGAANLDVSSSMSIGVGVPRNFYEMLGVGGGVLNDYVQAKHFFEIGNTSRAIEKILPTGLGNFVRAIRELNGATTLSGARVWDENGNPYVPNTGETAARVFGFRSAQLATMGERTWETKREIKSYSTEHNNILEAYRNYLVSKGSQEDFQEIMARIVKYNQDVISAGKVNEVPLIKYETLKRQAKQLTRPSKSMQAGLFQQ